jgi:hypothetical protein
MATTKITNPELFDLGSLDTALKLPSGTTAERPTSPSTGEWRYNTDNNLIEYYDGANWRELQSEDLPPIPSENFNTVLYTGNGSTQSITGVGFEPDFVWIKDRTDGTYKHQLYDSTRGATKKIFPNATNAESTDTTALQSFDTGGFTVGTNVGLNTNGNDYVAWCLKANGGTTSSNTDGTITSTVQANTKAGFSIISWTGTGSNGTIGTGLSTAADLIITKARGAVSPSVGEAWPVFHSSLTNNNIVYLDKTFGASSGNKSNVYQDPTTTSTTFGVETWRGINQSGVNMISYAFHSVEGYSKFGSYTGNGSTNGPIVETGFEPAFLMIKRTDTSGYNWNIWDNKRTPAGERVLYANLTNAESSYGFINFLSNGFQNTRTNAGINANGGNYIYMAFAADPDTTAPTLPDSFDTLII